MSKSHIGSQLPLSKYVVPIDPSSTVQLNHFDVDATDISGIRPYGAYVDESCVLYLDMNNVEGNIVYDKSRCNNYGTINGATACDGRNGKALSFDGINDYVKIKRNVTIEPTAAISISVWFMVSDNTRANVILSKTEGGSYSMSLNTTQSGYFSLYIHIGGSYGIVNFASSDVSNNVWHHVVATYDGSYERLYLDSIEKANLARTGTIGHATNTDLYIGCEASPGGPAGSFYGGKIDKVCIYNRAISIDEIYAHYHEGIYSIVPGYYGNAIAIEEATTNLCVSLGGNDYDILKIYSEDREYCTTIDIHGKRWLLCSNPNGSLRINSITVKPSTTYTWSFTAFTTVRQTKSIVHWDGIGYGNGSFVIDNKPTRITKTFTTQATSTYEILHILSLTAGQSYYFADFQLEEKPTATSFTARARDTGKLIYPNPIPGDRDFTISMWMNVHNKPTTTTSEPILTINNGPDINGVYMDVNSDTSLRLFVYNSNGVAEVMTTTEWQRNEWFHMAFVKQGTTISGYINGVLKCQRSCGTVNLAGEMKIGSRNSNFGYTNMLIDELRIDRVAATPEEILAWMVSSSPFYPRGIQRIAR